MNPPKNATSFATLACLLMAAAIAPAALGQGMLFPRPEVREWPFSLKSVRVNATITDALVETSVEQVFLNDTSVEQEATYLFPLPEGATVTSFTLKAGERVIEGRVLPKDEARAIYESIVRRRRDPALLEYMGGGLFRASVFPIPPHQDRVLTLRYAQVLRMQGGLYRFAYPLSTGRYSTRPASVSSVTVRIKTTSPLKTVYSPTHDVSVRRQDDRSASASWESRGEFPDRDFTLYYSTDADDVGLSVLTHRLGDEGTFMLIASPRVNVPNEKVLPREIVFVLDRTGSMAAGDKLAQAKNALNYCLDRLNATDRFNLITFNESPDALNQGLLAATRANVEKAHRFIADTEPSGGTNIDEALRTAVGLLRGETGTQKMVIFLTDGLPTVGETNVEAILAAVNKLNGTGPEAENREGVRARVFTFGVGADVNVPFLDRLAADTRGDADYVRPGEDIERIVSAFYGKVSSPILSDLSLDYDGVRVFDVFPRKLPDLFKGSQLIVTGRYRGQNGSIRLTGTALGRPVSFRLPNAFGEGAARSPLIPRIWAVRKIGFLLDEIRLHRNQEVIDEIIRLSREYGIVTPFTSYLADERDNAGPTPRELRGGGFAYDTSRDNAVIVEGRDRALKELSGSGAISGPGAVGQSLGRRGYQSAERAPAQSQGGFAGAGGGFGGGGYGGGLGKAERGAFALDYGLAGRGDASQAGRGVPGYRQMQRSSTVQAVGTRVFFRRGQVWFDNAYKSGQRVIKVQALSDAYFQLIGAVPEMSKYANVGDEVVLSFGRAAVQIGATGHTKLTPEEVREITAG